MKTIQDTATQKPEDYKRLREIQISIRISAAISGISWMILVVFTNYAAANDIMSVNLMFGISSTTGLSVAIVMAALNSAEDKVVSILSATRI